MPTVSFVDHDQLHFYSGDEPPSTLVQAWISPITLQNLQTEVLPLHLPRDKIALLPGPEENTSTALPGVHDACSSSGHSKRQRSQLGRGRTAQRSGVCNRFTLQRALNEPAVPTPTSFPETRRAAPGPGAGTDYSQYRTNQSPQGKKWGRPVACSVSPKVCHSPSACDVAAVRSDISLSP